jgi:hypothetical protein
MAVPVWLVVCALRAAGVEVSRDVGMLLHIVGAAQVAFFTGARSLYARAHSA